MLNTQDSSPPSPSPHPTLVVEIQSHLDDETDPEKQFPTFGNVEFFEQVARAVQTAARHVSVERGRIEIAIVNDAQIRQLNLRHLQHDWETDVISFSYFFDGSSVEGELILSWETAVREATKTGWPAPTEMVLYAIHGTLHLLGFDDAEPENRQQMRRVEKKVLAELQIAGHEAYDVDDGEIEESCSINSSHRHTRGADLS